MASLSAACKVQSLQRSQITARPRMAAAAQRAPRSVPCGGASGLRGTPLMPRLAAKPSEGRRQVAVHASWNRGGGDGSPDIADRVVASLPYLVPLLDGLRYGAGPPCIINNNQQSMPDFLPLFLPLVSCGCASLPCP